MGKDNNFEFPVAIYGNLERFNDVSSIGRCRIFYKGLNRNRTYITEEFAKKLISTLPYTPVKGIYDYTEEDYTDHGRQRYEGRIYGIVPENPNFAWETHLDEDGVEREYACVDILVYTALYKEAGDIVGSSQSMELYQPSITGEWKYIEGKKCFVFEDACFLGLQVLGKEVEPCFEGAGFYSLQKVKTELEELVSQLKDFSLKDTSKGGRKMPVIEFKLSDNQKYNMLWSLLNPNCNEEGNWTINYCICDVYDDYAVVFNIQDNGYERAYYTKDDESDSLDITKKEATYIVDVNEEEKNALKSLHSINNSYTELPKQFEQLKADKEALEGDLEEQKASYTTLEKEKEDVEGALAEAKSNYEAAQATIETLTSEKESLEQYRLDIETKEKERVIDKYSDKLEEEVINTMKEKISEYSAEELDKELAYALVNASPNLFTDNDPGFIPKDNEPDHISQILNKYERK